MSQPYTLYLTFQWLRHNGKEHQYHWGLWSTDAKPPAGRLFHATDAGRQALDLYYENRKVRDPSKSKSMVVCLMIAKSPKAEYLDHYASRIPLMNCSHLPAGEPQWTCRVWVKETLKALHEKGQIVLPADIDTIESYGKYTADRYLSQMGNPMIFNDLGWLSQTSAGNTHQQYYGAEPMETETYQQYQQQRYYGTKPMQTETYGQNARQYQQQTYYGTKPMQTETYQYNTYY
ncbi:uncharacterized protein FIESC28_00992 [Fusarium coffeatum]|uniref:Uncharacterized protein n=1 Tax=Fusarium coffeatum TaxID=231269 RepID=A0A366SA98_9HYPO|nr:uncharacterized protein FIESC28_00992 [Fusarium coffeatum]RBR26209.1 hypothetical protein FIESC28_00992 [Fusarium coffeatum]